MRPLRSSPWFNSISDTPNGSSSVNPVCDDDENMSCHMRNARVRQKTDVSVVCYIEEEEGIQRAMRIIPPGRIMVYPNFALFASGKPAYNLMKGRNTVGQLMIRSEQ